MDLKSLDLKSLERRIARIEDLEAIKQLKARYCDVCDDNHNLDRITDIFTEDGIWEGGTSPTRRVMARFACSSFILSRLPLPTLDHFARSVALRCLIAMDCRRRLAREPGEEHKAENNEGQPPSTRS
ncbi:MAG: hypothetical protein ACI8PT_000752 [Gammaproteobacteria bacterium]|jgi:hypothetical protein